MSSTLPGGEPLPLTVDFMPHVRRWAAGWRASGALALLLDFDGTLSPIVDRPDDARIEPAAQRALDRLADVAGVTMAVVSGRQLADVRGRASIPGGWYVGNHGMEIDGPGVRQVHPAATQARPALRRAAERLTAALQSVAGASVEDKGLSLSIHYRQVAEPEWPLVERVVAAEAANASELAVHSGKRVWELRPRGGWNKGDAVAFLLARGPLAPDAPALFAGDDVTDESAFERLRGRAAADGILIAAESRPTAATLRLESPVAFAALLTALADELAG